MRSRRQFLAAGTISAIAGCITAPTTSQSDVPDTATSNDGPTWPMIGYDTANTGYGPDAQAPAGSVGTVWRQPLAGDWTPRPPSGRDGVVYAQADKKVYAFDAADGELLWRTDVGLYTYPYTPTVTEDRVYVSARESKEPDTDAKVFGLDRQNGRVEWEYSNPLIDTSPALDGDTIYVQSQTRGHTVRVHAVDIESAEERWSFACEDCQEVRPALRWSPAVLDETMFLSVQGGDTVYALDTADGSIRWEESFDRPITSSAAVADGAVFVGNRDGVVFALEATSGDRLWTDVPHDEFGMIHSAPVVGDGRVVVAESYKLRALDASSGAVQWSRDIAYTNNSYLSLADGSVFVGGKHVTSYDLTDGEREWFYYSNVFHSLYTGAIVGDGMVFANSCIKEESDDYYDHYLHALGTG